MTAEPPRTPGGPPPGQPSATAPPAAPPGPGVTPPFPAPPTEGRDTRLWLGLLSGGLVALLCCGGGLTACVGLVVVGARAVNERAEAGVREYLDSVRAGRYADAYDSQCDSQRRRESLADFTARVRAERPVRDYTVGDAELTTGVRVPVEVAYADGARERWQVTVEQDTSDGDLEVCGIDKS